MYCVTAQVESTSTIRALSAGTNYYYDIDFGVGETLSSLIDLSFDWSKRPSFTIPPYNLNIEY